MPKKRSLGRAALNLVLLLICVLWIVPVLFIFVLSFTPESSLASVGYTLFPESFSVEAYTYIFKNPAQLLDSYKISIIVTVVGTVGGLFIITGLAWAMARKDFSLSKPLSKFMLFALLFHGGLIPTYIVVTQWLHLGDTIWALILTLLVSPWSVFLMRSFLSGIPSEIVEAASIDGASEWRVFFQMALPLSKSGLATIGLLTMFSYWNDWQQGMLYIDNLRLVPLQLLLYKIISNIQFILQNSFNMVTSAGSFPTIATRMATCVLAIAPMMVAFTFFQKYLSKGLMLGSVKG